MSQVNTAVSSESDSSSSVTGPRVLYITYDGLTDPLGQSQVLPYLKGLTAKGAQLVVLSCEKPKAFAARKETIAAECEKHGITWRHIRYTKRPPVLSTIRDTYAMKRLARELHRRYSFGLVHCRSYISALVGQALHEQFDLPYVFDMRGFWADERVDGGLWQQGNPVHRVVYRFFKRRERSFLESSAAVISLTEAAKQEMLTWGLRIEPEKIAVVPCCADLDHFDYSRFDAVQRTETRAALGIPQDALVLAYLGSIGTWYLVDAMLEYFQTLSAARPEARLLFICNDEAGLLRAKARSLGISDDKFVVTSVSRARVPELLFATDLNYFFIKPAYSKMSSSPTKLAEILGMGKPVICNKGVGDIEAIFQDGDLGIALDVEDREAWQQSIDAIDDLLALDPAAIRRQAIQHFSLARGVDAYHAVYSAVTS